MMTVGKSLQAGPKSGSVATQSTVSLPICFVKLRESPNMTVYFAFARLYSLFSQSRFLREASTHHGFISIPIVCAFARTASCKIVPTPQKGSNKTLPGEHEERFTIILANLGGIEKILR